MKAKKIAALLIAASLAATSITGCAINKNATVATLNDEDISLGLVNFMIRYVQATNDDMYIQYMGEKYWNENYGGDGTVLDTWKDNAIEQVHELYTLKDHMKDYDVEITDDEKTEIENVAKQFMEDNSENAIDEMGATEDIVKEYLELRLIKSKMYAAIIAKADSDVTDEEANMASYTMIQIDYAGHYDANYQYQAYSDEEKAQLKAQADLIAQAIASGTSLEDAAQAAGVTATPGTYATYVDPETAEKDDDSEVTENTNPDGSVSGKDSVYTTNSIDSAVVDALNGLEEGQTADMITTDSAYYFVRLDSKTDSDATESNRKTVKGNKEDKFYNKVISDWQDDEKWKVKENQLKKIDIHNYFTTKTESTETESTESESTVSDDTEFVPVTETTEVTETVQPTESEQ